jgi:RecA-family ATPase
MTELYGNLRQPLIDLGYRPIPILPNDKRPAVKGWNKPDFVPATDTRFAGYSVGIVCGLNPYAISAIDIDVTDATLSQILLNHVLTTYGETVYRIGKAPKVLLVYRTSVGFRKQKSAKFSCGNVEVLSQGQQFVAYGLHPTTKQPYHWPGLLGDLKHNAASLLSVLTETDIRDILQFFEQSAKAAGFEMLEPNTSATSAKNAKPANSTDYDPTNPLDVPDPTGKTITEIQAMLSILDPDCSRGEWISVGMALHHEVNGSAEGLAVWNEWSATGGKYHDGEPERLWSSFGDYSGRPVTLRSIIKRVKTIAAEARLSAPIKSDGGVGGDGDEWTAKALHAGHFIHKTPPKLAWVVPGLLPKGLTGIVSGEGGETYKSTLMLDLCITMALAGVVKNSKWLSTFSIPDAGRSLYISLEDSKDALHRRIHPIFANKCGLEDLESCKAAYSDNFYVLTREMFFDDRKHETLLDERGGATVKFERLRTALELIRPELVIIDTRAKAASVDENDNALNSRLMTVISSLCDVGRNGMSSKATVLLLSHVSKAVRSGVETNSLNAVRGAGSLGDDARWLLWVRPLSEKDKENRPLIEIINAKNSYAAKAESIIVAVQWPDFVPTNITRDKIKELKDEDKIQRLKEKIIVLLSDKGEMHASNIREALNARKHHLIIALQELSYHGRLKKSKNPQDAREICYSAINVVPK